MATEYLFSNNATTTLAQSVSATATVLNVASGTGGMFPNPGSGQAFAVTLVDAETGLTNEICYCTSRSGDQLTVTRGQEGTNATSWQAGDTCANYITAEVMESWLQESDLNGYATEAWASGLFATIADLNAETHRATTIESNLQTSVNQKVNRAGDTMTGTLTVEGSTGGVVAQYNPGSPAVGSFINYPGFVSIASGRGGKFYAQLQEVVGTKFSGLFSLQNGDGNWRYVGIPWNQRINDSQFGDVVYTADLSNYVPASTYTSDFATSDSRVLNLPYGHKIQKFTFQGTPNAGQLWVPFPEAFSDIPVVMMSINNETIGAFSQRYVCIRNNTDGQNSPNITSTGFLSYSAWGNSAGTYASTSPLTLQVIAFGAK